tara:strand:- start:3529 stop:4995 length:1467 start_codon:yes stop_codon:yes gene_type:complete
MQEVILNYLRYFCQLKRLGRLAPLYLIFPFLLSGCGTSKSVMKKITQKVKGSRASIPELASWESVTNRDGKMPETGHAFFSFSPRMSSETGLTQAILTTPAGSPYRYEFHLPTGQVYRTERYCKQRDVWRSFKSSLTKPPFHEGFIPRLMDATGNPQKILVFGSKAMHPFNFDRFSKPVTVKIVGGVQEQYCRRYPCSKQGTWQKRMVLIGIDPLHEDFMGVKTFKKFKKVSDWKYAKSFIENSQGRTSSFYDPEKDRGDNPSYRIVGSFEKESAMRYVTKSGHLFKEKEILTMKKSCDKIYSFLWQASKIFKKAKSIKKSDSKETQKSFGLFFSSFFEDFGRSYRTCSKFMGSTKREKNMGKVWFFSFLDGVFHLANLGYSYDCEKKAWAKNVVKNNSLFLEKDQCGPEDVNDAFDSAVTTLGILYRNKDHSYMYKTYDFGPGGTHQRIYSWVFNRGKKILCVNENEKLSFEDTQSSFPNDVRWTPL